MPKQMGYLMVDHRASPGLPEEVARWAGYDPRFCGEGKVYEVATLHCSHCGGHGIPNPQRTRARATCFECDNKEGHYICDACDYLRHQPGYVHTPFVKFVDDYLDVAANPCSTRELPLPPALLIQQGSPQKLLFPEPDKASEPEGG
jgi:hypothetical protein